VVLDWLLFCHPDGLVLGTALTTGELRWIATAAMREELTHVLGRGLLDRWRPNLPSLLADWATHCAETSAPETAGRTTRFRCTDPDDQKFIDLAVARAPCLLLSRDRAVLKLARRLREVGVDVVTPAAWVSRRATG